MLLLEYHDAVKYFSYIYCNANGNKFANLIKSFKFVVNDLIVFENEDREIQNALMVGILPTKIFKVDMFS